MIINLTVPQSYRCIDRKLFEEELQYSRNQFFFLKEVQFIRPDGTNFIRNIFVTDDTIERIETYDDGLRDTKVFFRNKHPELIKDRQHNSFFADVKYLSDIDMVVLKNIYYDISSEFSTFQIVQIEQKFSINPKTNASLLKDVIFKLVCKKIDSYVDATEENYRYESNELLIQDKKYKVPEKDVIHTSQYSLFINDKTCIICLLKNEIS